MKPVLFEADSTNFDNNGIAVLYDATSCTVTEEYNGAFDMEMEYPTDGDWSDYITEGRIVLAKPNDVDDPHAFRIYQVEKDLDSGTITVMATSITDDLAGNLIISASITDGTPQQAFTQIKNNLIEQTIFDFVSDIQTTSSSAWTRINPLQAIVGTTGSLVDLWGGDIKRTNNTVYLYSRRGKDHVTVIRPGKNIDGFNMTVSTKGLITKILPFYTYTPDAIPQYEMVDDGKGNMVKQAAYSTTSTQQEQVTVTGEVVVSPNAGNYAVQSYSPVDYTNNTNISDQVKAYVDNVKQQAADSPTVIDNSGFADDLQNYIYGLLNQEAAGYFIYNNPGCDEPGVSFKVDMIEIADSPEWEMFKNLETIQVTDTVDVYVKEFNVDIAVTIQSIVYDSIGEKINTITAGSATNNLVQSITKTYENTAVAIVNQYIATSENGVYNAINRTADGQAKRFDGYTEPPAEISTDGDLWFKQLGDGNVDVYIYSSGMWQPKVSGPEVIARLVAEGIDAKKITVSNLDAGSITGGDLEVTESFRIMHNGTPVLEVDAQTGQVKITAPNLATQTDLQNVELTPGPTGTGISSVVEYFLATSSASGVTTSTSGWTTTMQGMTSTNKYLWNYEVTTYTDGTTRVTTPGIIGTFGNDGKGITSVTDYYLATTASSGVTTSTSGWTSTIQSITATNKYLWRYETITFTDNTTSNTTPVIIGVYGDKGNDGKGITSVTEYYLATSASSGITTATTGWTTTIQTLTSTNKYLWNYTKTVFTDNTTQTDSPMIIGSFGVDGKGISLVTKYYLASSSSSGVTTSTTGWTTTMQNTTDTNRYLWSYEVITYTDSTTSTVSPIIIGVQGAKGDTGTSISNVTEYYLASSSVSGVTTATTGWDVKMPTLDETNKYLWNYTKTTLSDGTIESSDTIIIGIFSSDGKGVATVVQHYLATSASTGVTTSTTGWTTTVQTIDATNKYLWTYEHTTYTDLTSSETTPVVIGVYGDKGSTGVGISSVTQYYLASSDSSTVTTATTGWTTTVQRPTTTNKYLWNYEKTTYTDTTSTTTTPAIIGTYGDTGAGVSSVTEYYLATSASSGVTTATTGWTTAVQNMTTTNKYLWNYEVVNYSDGTNQTIAPVLIGVYGPKGDAGLAVSSIVQEYYLSTSSTSQTGGSWGSSVPTQTSTTYIWVRTKTTFSDSTTTTTNPVMITGSKGNDGTTYYTWVKYAVDQYGGNMSDSPTGMRYIGIAVNKTSATESTTASDYTWSPLYDNVDVGGRNLYLDSYLERVLAYSAVSTITITESTSDYTNLVRCDHKGVTGDSLNFGFKQATSDQHIKFWNGLPYTISFKARGNVGNLSYTYFMRNSSEGSNSGMGSNSVALDTTNWATVTIYSTGPFDTSTGFILIGSTDGGTGKWFEVKEIMLEQGNVATDWVPSLDDIQIQINDKASSGDMDAMSQAVSDVASQVSAKTDYSEFKTLKDNYDAFVEQNGIDSAAVSTALQTMDGRMTLAETLAGNNKIVTDFINTVITESDEGIYIANGASSTGILIASDRISFMDNNVEVAYISNQTMQINHGIFVESAIIANFKFEAIPGTTILAIQWVGG